MLVVVLVWFCFAVLFVNFSYFSRQCWHSTRLFGPNGRPVSGEFAVLISVASSTRTSALMRLFPEGSLCTVCPCQSGRSARPASGVHSCTGVLLRGRRSRGRPAARDAGALTRARTL